MPIGTDSRSAIRGTASLRSAFASASNASSLSNRCWSVSSRRNPAARSSCEMVGESALSWWCGEQKRRKRMCGSSLSRSTTVSARRDLPIPASPDISTTEPSPRFICCQRRISSSISSSRPSNEVLATRKASKRLSTALAPTTRQTGTRSLKPVMDTLPRARYSKSPPTRRRVLPSMTTVFGSASA